MLRTRFRLGWPAIAVVVAAPGMAVPAVAAAANPATTASPSSDSDQGSGITTLQEIVVATNRYEATDLQLKAPNMVSVLSADDLANTAVHNAAEALGLLPGVNVLNTSAGSFIGGVDSAARAEGMFTSVRGMDAEFNVNLINGVNVAQGMPYSREVQLSLLPPSGLKTIVLNKTSLADMDGDAIGGTVDFRTPTAFDFHEAQGSVTVGTRIESRPIDYHDNGLGYNAAADISRRFGSNQQFGVYASAYYDLRHFVNSEMGGVMEATCCDNAWAFKVADANGKTPAGINPADNLELTGFNVGASSGYTKQFGGNASFDWRPDDSLAAYIRVTYAYALTRQDSQLSQVVGMGVLQGSASPYALGNGLYQPDIANVSIRDWMESNPEVAELGTLQVGGDKKLGQWTLSPNVFFSWGRDDRPDHIEIDARTSHVQGGDITDNGFPYGGTSLFTYANGFAFPTLTPEMTQQLYNIRGLPAFDRGELQAGYSGQVKGGGRFDVRYDFGDGLLEFAKFGVKYQTSARHVSFRDWTNPGFFGGTYGDLPIWDGDFNPVFPGKYGWSVPKVNEPALLGYYASAASPNNLDTCGSIYVNSLYCNNHRGTEDVAAAYGMLQLHPGDWEITPGVRFEHTYIHNTFWTIPSQCQPSADGTDPCASTVQLPGSFTSNHTTYDEVLPSIFVNYRPVPGAVYRGGIWTSYTRPAFFELGAGQGQGGASITPSANGVTTISEGNPNLKPVKAINYDLSGEWDNGTGRHLMAAVYFKKLQNYIYDTVSQQPNANGIGGTIVKQPLNAGDGQVWGIELGARQRFEFLPAPFDGFGISGTLTREHTLVHLNVPGFNSSEPIQNAPDWLANIEAFYEKRGLSVGVIWNYAGEYLAQYDFVSQGANWDDLWVRSRRRVDLHAGYAFDSGLKLDVSVANLLKDYTYWSHIGKYSLADSDIVDSGLTALVNVTYRF
jgi:TonB-dependent receptor